MINAHAGVVVARAAECCMAVGVGSSRAVPLASASDVGLKLLFHVWRLLLLTLSDGVKAGAPCIRR
jgi:hypothetical protein